MQRHEVHGPLFRGFGTTRVALRRKLGTALPIDRDFKRFRAQLRRLCPRRPGVYGFVDSGGRLVYVGMSQALSKRLVTYFFERRGSKESRIAQHASQVLWEPTAHPFIACLREVELIRRWRPNYNVRDQPRRQRSGYIYLSGEDAPRFRIATMPPKGCRHFWGELLIHPGLRAAVERLNEILKLRDCPSGTAMHFMGEGFLFAESLRTECLRGAVDRCLAPCVAKCTRRQYTEQITLGRRLLDGQDSVLLDDVQRMMRQASANRRFEQAARWRDTWTALMLLAEQLQKMREVQRDYWFVYPITVRRRSALWYVVAGGSVVAIARQPMNRRGAAKVEQLVTEHLIRRRPAARQAELAPRHAVTGWFRRHPRELLRILSPEQALAACRGQW